MSSLPALAQALRVHRAWVAVAAVSVLSGAVTWGWIGLSLQRRLAAPASAAPDAAGAPPLSPEPTGGLDDVTFPAEIFDQDFEDAVLSEARRLGMEHLPPASVMAEEALLRRSGSCFPTLRIHLDAAPTPSAPRAEVLRFCALHMILDDLEGVRSSGLPPAPPDAQEQRPEIEDILWDDADEPALDAELARVAALLGVDADKLPSARSMWEALSSRGVRPGPELRARIIQEGLPGELDPDHRDPVRELLLMHLLHLARMGGPPDEAPPISPAPTPGQGPELTGSDPSWPGPGAP